MDHVEMYNTDEVSSLLDFHTYLLKLQNKSSKIRKKSAFLPDGSHRIFYITKKGEEDSDDDDHQNNIDQIIDKKSSKVKDQNGLVKKNEFINEYKKFLLGTILISS